MRTIAVLFLLFIFLTACEKDGDNNSVNPLDNAAFQGYFTRTGMDTVSVTLQFEEDRFHGTSTRDKYPAICHGSYQVTGNQVSFRDSCSWTADFDWSNILDGNFQWSEQDKQIRIWRSNGNITDEYVLTKLIR